VVRGPHTELLPGPEGDLEVLTVGHGHPSTVFAHGLAGSIPTTRPYAVRVPGRRTFLHFRGHGRSTAPEGAWDYPALARELWTVADQVGADRALGVSMGAGALCAGLAADPARFSRLVLVLPAVIDRPRDDAVMGRFARLAALVDAGDTDGVAAHLLAEQPADLHDDPGVRRWCREQAERLVGTPVGRALRALPHQRPLADRSALAAVTAETLVLAQEDDPTHPVAVAEEVAGLLPRARLVVLPPGGIMWRHRARVRDLVGSFLSTVSTEPGVAAP
jgi:pimeloyl-ACP methyl ester carboxylesterase